MPWSGTVAPLLLDRRERRSGTVAPSVCVAEVDAREVDADGKLVVNRPRFARGPHRGECAPRVRVPPRRRRHSHGHRPSDPTRRQPSPSHTAPRPPGSPGTAPEAGPAVDASRSRGCAPTAARRSCPVRVEPPGAENRVGGCQSFSPPAQFRDPFRCGGEPGQLVRPRPHRVPTRGSSGAAPARACSHAETRSASRMRHDTPSTARWWMETASRPARPGPVSHKHHLQHHPGRGVETGNGGGRSHDATASTSASSRTCEQSTRP